MSHRLAFFMRVLWVLALLTSLGMLFAALPGYVDEWVGAQRAAGGQVLAIAWTWLNASLSLSAVLVSFGLAYVLFWKKRNDRMTLFLSFFLLLYGSVMCGALQRLTAHWLPQTPDLGTEMQTVLIPLPLLILLLIFPNGQFIPRTENQETYYDKS